MEGNYRAWPTTPAACEQLFHWPAHYSDEQESTLLSGTGCLQQCFSKQAVTGKSADRNLHQCQAIAARNLVPLLISKFIV